MVWCGVNVFMGRTNRGERGRENGYTYSRKSLVGNSVIQIFSYPTTSNNENFGVH